MSSNLKLRWSTWYTAIICAGVFIVWLATKFTVYIFGIHLHHFYYGFFYLIFGFYSMVEQRKRYMLKTAHIKVTYTVIPWLLIALGLMMILTDWADMVAFINSGVPPP